MNEILNRATQELAKENPDIAYIRGMLETLLVMNTSTVPMPSVSIPVTIPVPTKVEVPANDEGAILDAQTRALLGKIPPPVEE